MGMSVQFVGIANVLQSFEDRKIEAWAIFVHKQMLTKGWGSDQLQAFLTTLDNSGTNAIYTLKVYEDITDERGVSKIKSNTADDGAVNFRLDPQGLNPPAAYSSTRWQQIGYRETINDRLQKIEEALLKLAEEKQAEAEEEEEEESIGSIFMDMIKNPAKASALVDVIKSITTPGHIPQTQYTPPMPATVGTVNTANQEQSQENRLDRLAAAINILEQKDPGLIDHLEKLAIMAQDQPKKFANLLSMLEMM